MTGPDRELERLQIEIELKRAALFEHRARLFQLQSELDSFADEYHKTVGWLEADLEDIEHEIQAEQRRVRADDEALLGPGIYSFADYLSSRQAPPNEPIQPLKPPVDDNDVRALYRKLARQFHPDTTTDPEEKARLSVIMARINAAYNAKDLEALRKIEGQPVAEVLGNIPGVVQPGVPMTRESLLELSRKLDDEIMWTKIEHQNLLNSPLMRLRIECSLSRSQGQNLLREMAIKTQRELDAARARLADLRRGTTDRRL